jgi:enoyl-[acyl-carrier protein] reductase I
MAAALAEQGAGTIDAAEVGRVALLLASDYTAAITGEVLYVDAGFRIEGMVLH